MTLPSFLQIEPVGQCNLRCQMCPIQFRRDGPPWGPPAFVAFDKYCSLIDAFAPNTELHLQGLGEPMMHPRFFDMIAYAVGKGFQVTTNSNLTLLTPSRAEACVKSGLYRLFGSIDGSTAETYERIRVNSDHELIWRNLRSLFDARSRLGSETPHVKIVMVIMRENLDELPDLVRQARALGAEGLSVQHLCHDFGEESLPAHYAPMRDFVEEQTLLNEDAGRVERVFEGARNLARELGFDLRLPNLKPIEHPPGTPGPRRCDWPWRGAYVSYDGRAMPCCMVATPDRANFGNMLESGAEAVWHGDAYNAFREKLSSDEPPDICKSCSVYRGIF